MNVIRFEKAGDIGRIVLCDPPDNRLGRQFVDELQVAVHEASLSGVRVVVVRSEGPNFGTGADVIDWPGKDVNWFHTFISELNHTYKALEALRVPTVAAVRGKAVGGHYELLLHCDFIVAARTATFLAVEARTGMVPLVGGTQRLAERIGRGRTLQYVMLAEPLTGTVAGEIGLAYKVVEDDHVEAVAEELARTLASGATLAYGATRALLKAWSSGGVSGADDLLLDLSMRLFQSNDAQHVFQSLKEAVAAGEKKSEAETQVQGVFLGE